jgi:hypothetical protein
VAASSRSAGELWQAITGAMPENMQSKGLPSPLLSTASGEWLGMLVDELWQELIGVRDGGRDALL